MSYHVRSSRDARIRLATQHKNSTVSSFLISLLFLVLIGTALYFIKFRNPLKEPPEPVFRFSLVNFDRSSIQGSSPSPPNEAESHQVITVESKIVEFTKTYPPKSKIEATAESFPGEHLQNLPSEMRTRCDARHRAERLTATGGTPATDEAITRALDWLTSQQKENGAWADSKHTEHQPGLTGLALLSYLGRCHTPVDDNPTYAEAVLRGTTFLINLAMTNRGRLTQDFNDRWSYDHSIACYALCESLIFSRSLGYSIPNLEASVQDSISWIIQRQNKENHGWSYTYATRQRTDTSINAWHIQALHAAQKTGLTIQGLENALDKALLGLVKARQNNGAFSYTPAKHKWLKSRYPLTAPAALCFQLRQKIDHPICKKAVHYLTEQNRYHLGPDYDLYEHYYLSQVMMNHSAAHWERYRRYTLTRLLKRQAPSGRWKKFPRNRWSTGPIYDSCLSILILEAHYRFLFGSITEAQESR